MLRTSPGSWSVPSLPSRIRAGSRFRSRATPDSGASPLYENFAFECGTKAAPCDRGNSFNIDFLEDLRCISHPSPLLPTPPRPVFSRSRLSLLRCTRRHATSNISFVNQARALGSCEQVILWRRVSCVLGSRFKTIPILHERTKLDTVAIENDNVILDRAKIHSSFGVSYDRFRVSRSDKSRTIYARVKSA